MNKKFPNSSLLNKVALLNTVLIFIAGVLFIFSDKVSLAVGAIWISAGALWLLRYSWQVRTPYIEISNGELTINKSPILKKKFKISELKGIVKSTKFSLILELNNGKKTKISLFQVEKGKRDELLEIIKEITAE